jgi:hypothetical protein
MIDYICTKGRARVRVLAYRPVGAEYDDGNMKVVFQAMNGEEPIADSPVLEEVTTPLCLAKELSLMRGEGWEINPSKRMFN